MVQSIITVSLFVAVVMLAHASADTGDAHSTELMHETRTDHQHEASNAVHDHDHEASNAVHDHKHEAGNAVHDHMNEASNAVRDHEHEASNAVRDHKHKAQEAHHHHDHKTHDDHPHGDHAHGSCKSAEGGGSDHPSETATRDALIAVSLISCASLFSIPILPLLSSKENLAIGMSFAAGSLIADVFLHVLPHEMMSKCENSHGHSHGHEHAHSHNLDDIWGETREGLLLILGFVLFMLLAKVVQAFTGEVPASAHGHSHSTHSKDDAAGGGDSLGSGAVVLLIADASHNFTDGLAVGAAFLVSPARGFTTALAVFFHELPHEVGDIAVLIGEGMDKWSAVRIQFMTAGGALVGCLLGLLSGNLWSNAGSVIGLLSAGGFLYVAMVTVVPKLMAGGFWQTLKELIAMCAGVGMMVLILLVE